MNEGDQSDSDAENASVRRGEDSPGDQRESLKVPDRTTIIAYLRRVHVSATQTAGSTGPTPHVVAATADSVSWVKLVEVSGDGGVLTGLGVAGGPDYRWSQRPKPPESVSQSP